MCFICDGGTEEELDELIDSFVSGEPGWFVSGVYDDDGPPGWAYSIGLQERFDHPELLMNGHACFHCAGKVINDLGHRIAAGEKFVVGDLVWLPDGDGEVRFGRVHPNHWLTDTFNGWKGFYRARRPSAPPKVALQVIWTDDLGRWQDDARNRSWSQYRMDRSPRLPKYKTKHRRRK